MLRIILICVAGLLVAGCTENQPPAKADGGVTTVAGKPHAACLVCKHENDLACVDIEVTDKTPRTSVDGKEYYFCSESCKKEFAKDPKKYVARATSP